MYINNEPHEQTMENGDVVFQQQSFVFDKIFNNFDHDDLYTFLACLSDTIAVSTSNLHQGFLSESFVQIIQFNITEEFPLISEACIILITKLLSVYDFSLFTKFYSFDFLDLYAYLLQTNIYSLKLSIVRLFALISSHSSNEALICERYSEQIIKNSIAHARNNDSKDDNLLLYGSTFVLQIIKLNNPENNISNNFFWPTDLFTLFSIIDSENSKIKAIGLEIFRYGIFRENNDINYNDFIELIEKVLFLSKNEPVEIISSSIRILDAYALKSSNRGMINQNSDKSYNLLKKSLFVLFNELLFHRSATVRLLSSSCIGSLALNLNEIDYNFLIERIGEIVSKGNFKEKKEISSCLSAIVMKVNSTAILKLPIKQILRFFLSMLVEKNQKNFGNVLQAIGRICQTIDSMNLSKENIDDLINYDFSPFLLNYGPFITNITEVLAKHK